MHSHGRERFGNKCTDLESLRPQRPPQTQFLVVAAGQPSQRVRQLRDQLSQACLLYTHTRTHAGWQRCNHGHVTLAAITITANLVSYLEVKSLQFIWRSGTRRWNLRAPDLQMCCRDLTTWPGTRRVAPAMAAGRRAPWSPTYTIRTIAIESW